MSFEALLINLKSEGIQLRKVGQDLKVQCAKGQLNPDLVQQLRTHKPALLDLIAEDSEQWWDPPTIITPDMLKLVELTRDEIAAVVATVPGGADNIQSIYPLTPLQEGILFHHMMKQQGDVYLLSCMYRFASKLVLDKFLAAMQAVMRRHDILRTAILWEGVSQPVQVVWREVPLPVQEFSVSAGQGSAAEQLQRFCNPRNSRIDVRRAPLMRAVIAYDEQQNKWLLQLLWHHLAGDLTTLQLMESEIQAFLLGQGEQLPKAAPFRNLVAQARLGVSSEEHEQFFRTMLADIDEPTAPFGLLEIQGDGSELAEARVALDGVLYKRLRERARRLGVSMASLCHCAFAQVVARASARTNVVFGTVMLGRMQGGEGADRVMGLVLNTLPVRIGVDSRSVENSVRDTHATLTALMRHEHAPLALAQRCSSVLAPAPLFTALLNYRHGVVSTGAQGNSAAWTGIEALHDMNSGQSTNYPLTLSIDDFGSGMELFAQAQAPVTPERICAFMQQALQSLALALEETPMRALAELDVMPTEEWHWLIRKWNATQVDYPTAALMHQLFEQQARLTPDAIALRCHDDSMSYAELNGKANQLAHELQARGIAPNLLVGVFIERGFDMVIAVLAVLKAGGAYVPLDPVYPADRIAFMLHDAQALVLLTQQSLLDSLHVESLTAQIICLDKDQDWLRQRPTSPIICSARKSDLAYIIYTSGSTGQPKGVVISHDAACNTLHDINARFSVDAHDVVLALSSLAFDLSVYDLFGSFAAGATVVIPAVERVANPVAWQQLIRQHRVTVWNSAPALLQLFVDDALSARAAVFDSIKLVMLSGDWIGLRLAENILKLFPNATFYSLGGATEASIWSVHFPVKAIDPAWTSVPYGRALGNQAMYVLDALDRPCPMGVAGHLHIGGVGVAQGYWRRPELNAEKFVRDPFRSEANGRMYRTGDLARWRSDGQLEFLGRMDFQVKIRGYRIELGEIEARMLAFAGIREAVVLVRELGPGDRRLVAYYTCGEPGTPVHENSLSIDSLKNYLLGSLPEYMVPAAYVAMASMPVTSNGKLDRKALPAPGGNAYASKIYVAPEGDIENRLAIIWAELLQLEQVGRHDNFFELGGHSLLIVSLIERMRRNDLYTDVRALFAAPTLAQLAKVIESASVQAMVPENGIPQDCTQITPEMLTLVQLDSIHIDRIVASVPGGARNIQDIYPLAPLQEGFLYHHLMNHSGDAYLLSNLLTFDTRARMEVFLGALQQVVNRHDILRTALFWEGLPEPVQVVWRDAPLSVHEVVLDPQNGDAVEQLCATYNTSTYRIDVRLAPMMQVHYAYDAKNDRWLLLKLMHHLNNDHTTLQRLFTEAELIMKGQFDKLPEPRAFRQYVAQARMGVTREEHEAFFTDLLGDIDEPTAPFGMLDVHRTGAAIDEYCYALDDQLTIRLRSQARRFGTSVASLCHVAFAQVLARVSGRRDVVFGSVFFGRARGGLGADDAVGLFINTLPVRIDISADNAVSCVRKTHNLLAQLMHHEHASLALAQRCSAVKAPTPLFSSLLNCRQGEAGSEQRVADILPGWEGIELIHQEERSNYAFDMSVDDFGDRLSLTAQVDINVGAERICKYMNAALYALADALQQESDTAVGAFDVMPATERLQVLQGFNDTFVAYPQEQLIHQLFEAQVERQPDAIAVISGGRQISYRELNERANRIAFVLHSLGVKPDDRVGLCLERTPGLIAGMLGILKAGAAYVALDPAYPPDRLTYMMTDAAPVALLVQAHLKASLAATDVPVWVLDDLGTLESQAELPVENTHHQELTARHLAYLIYTSGSTGIPKGVMVEHRQAVNFIHAHCQGCELTADDRVLQFASASFDSSVAEIFPALASGACIVLRPDELMVPDAGFMEFLQQHRISVVDLPTAFWRHWSRALADQVVARMPRLVIVSGEKAEHQTLVDWIALAGNKSSRWQNNYGPTEATVNATAIVYDRSSDLSSECLPIGRPIANTRVYILDDRLEPVPVGVTGELYIAGAGVARGYLNQPGLSSARFVADCFNAEKVARMYKTGDLGRWLPDGNIEYLGRNDFQVKIRGFRIELGEIEARLVAAAGVHEAVVVAREDSPGDQRLVAYVTLAASDAFAEQSTLEATQVSHWQELYDHNYAQSSVNTELNDFFGWDSSYTGQAIPQDEMREWQDNTLARIRTLQPKRVLEIGCGNGLLLLKLAPECTAYVGCDFSAETIVQLESVVRHRQLSQVQLFHRTADNLFGLGDDCFDTIIINSVIQYFPNSDYLLKVIEAAVQLLTPDGALFVGDVRNLQLLPAFHTATQLFRSHDHEPIALLKERVSRAMAMEEELFVAPDFFLALTASSNYVADVELLPKLGAHDNELTEFRYDVILRRTTRECASPVHCIDWQQEQYSSARLRDYLRQQTPPSLVLRNIVNRRTLPAAMACEFLRGSSEKENLPAAELRDKLASLMARQACIDTQTLVSLAEQAGYAVTLSWAGCGEHGQFHALLSHSPRAAFPVRVLNLPRLQPDPHSYANDPLGNIKRKQAAIRLREVLMAQLPEHMVPGSVVVLDQLPLTRNGKLDRQALPAPELLRRDTELQLPQTADEMAIAAVWAELLHVDQVGRNDNFFELGGHSLLAISVIERLRAQGLMLDAKALFTTTTLAELAAAVGPRGQSIVIPPNLIVPGTALITPDMLPLVTLSQSEIDSVAAAVPGGNANIQDIYPLSPLQEGILFHHRLQAVGDAYLLAHVFRFRDRARLDAYITALQAVIDRHDILRTAVLWQGLPEAVQVVLRQAPLSVQEVVLPDGTVNAAEYLQERYNPTHTRVDVRQAPMLAAYVARDPVDDSLLLVQLEHHLIGDHTTTDILISEIEAFLTGQSALLPKPVPYRDLVAQAKLSVTVAEHEAYFRSVLHDVSEPTIPYDVLTDEQSGAREHLVTLPAVLTSRLRDAARRLGVSTASLCHLAFAQVLARTSNRKDIVFGTVLFGRMQGGEGIDRAIGLFINTLPFRVQIDAQSIEVAVREVHSRLSDLVRHEHAPLALAQRCSAVKAPMPLFSAILNYRHTREDTEPGSVPPKAWDGIELLKAQDATSYPVSLSVDDLGSTLNLWALTCPAIDPESVCALMQCALEQIAEALSVPLARCLSDIDVLPKSERARVLTEWNRLTADYPRNLCVHQCYELQAASHPDAIALDYQGQTWSYAELEARANQIAHWLLANGAQPDARVAILLERSADMVAGMLGILKAGAAYVPLDPSHPVDRLDYLLRDSAPIALLTRSELLLQLPRNDLPVLQFDNDFDLLNQQSTQCPDGNVQGLTPRHLAYLIYTSGSTGEPKGVMVEHHNINHLVINNPYVSISAEDTVVHCANPAFDASTWEIWATLLNGARLLIVDTDVLLKPKAFGQLLREKSVNVLHLTIGLFNQYVDELTDLFPRLKYLMFGGEQADISIVNRVLRQSPPRHLVHCYGPTETTTFATTLTVTPAAVQGARLSIGRPIANAQIYVLDEQMRPAPVGVAGQIFIGGAGVARGYWNRAELSRDRFITDPFSGLCDARMYKTGDLGCWLPDGSLAYLGRNDCQVKIRGFRIELGEIESRLSACAGVREAVVLAQQNPTGDRRLIAYVVLALGSGTSVAEPGEQQKQEYIATLKAELQKNLPEYMIPSAFVFLAALPLSANGKVDRKTLTTTGDVMVHKGAYVAPRYQLEDQLCGFWQEVLNIERVGVHDNFFDLGGNSLLTIKLQQKIESCLGREIPLTDIFAYPTIDALCRYLNVSIADTTDDFSCDTERTVPDTRHQDIAIIGMSMRFPDANDADQFWQNLASGRESLQQYSDSMLQAAGVEPALIAHPDYVKSGFLLDGVKEFDAAYFAYTPREVMLMDPQQRYLLECAVEALDNAGYGNAVEKRHVGVFAGASDSSYVIQYLLPLLGQQISPLDLAIGSSKDFTATRIAYKLNLVGPGISVGTACSTSLVAVHQACNSLRLGECRMALAGAAGITQYDTYGYLYQEGDIHSPDGHCRAFDQAARGTRGGNGAGMVLLKRLDDALTDGDNILAVIKGSAINNDGANKIGFTAPSVSGQAGVIREAQRQAGITAQSIQYIEAHGTGTVLGDPIEIRALSTAFASTGKQFCAVGSVKTNLGHLDAAAGIAGLIKTVLALRHKQLPPSLHYDVGNPQIDFANSPFYVNTQLREWPSGSEPRRAGVSSFGIGGTNAHVVLEEAPVVAAGMSHRPVQLLVLSAKTETALATLSGRLSQQLTAQNAQLQQAPSNNSSTLADIAFTLQLGRTHHAWRRVLVGETLQEMIAQLAAVDGCAERTEQAGSVVMLFSGQGSQFTAMGLGLYHSEPVFKQVMDRCADYLQNETGTDIRELLYTAASDETAVMARLNQTAVVQPALFALEYSLACLWRSWGVKPDAMIGHSLGEYVAACVAGVFSLEEGLHLVATRGRLMQTIAPGGMLSLLLSETETRSLIAGTQCELAAINGSRQCVVSGPVAAINSLQQKLQSSGTGYRSLKTSHAFHCAMMDDVLASFRKALQQVRWQAPTIPYISNLTGSFIRADQATSVDYWLSHLRETVQFSAGLDCLLADTQHLRSKRIFLEVGPGRTLVNLLRQHAPGMSHVTTHTLRSGQEQCSDTRVVQLALGQLWKAGIDIDWSTYHAHEHRRRVSLPAYPFERQPYWPDLLSMNSLPQLPVTLGESDSTTNRFCTPLWQPTAPALLQPTAKLSSCLVLMDPGETSAQLVAEMQKQFASVFVLSRGQHYSRTGHIFTVREHELDDYRQVVAILAQESALPERIVHGWNMPADSHAASESMSMTGVYPSIVNLCQSLSEMSQTTPMRLYLLANRMFSLSCDESLHLHHAALPAVADKLEKLFSNLQCQCIDVQPADFTGCRGRVVLASLTAEICSDSQTSCVAYRSGRRWRQTLEMQPMDQVNGLPALLRRNGVYLLCGALDGFGLALAEYLATEAQAKLVLVMHAAFPPRSQWQSWLDHHLPEDEISAQILRLQPLIAEAADVLVLTAELSDAQQLEQVVNQAINQFGAIHGVVHTDMPLHRGTRTHSRDGGLFALAGQTSVMSMTENINTRILATLALRNAIQACAPDFFAMCTIASVEDDAYLQTANAAVHTVQGAIAQQYGNDEKICHVAIHWAGAQTTAENNACTMAECVDDFIRIMSRPLPQWRVMSRQFLPHSDVDAAAANALSALSTQPRNRALVTPRNPLEQALLGIWHELFGVTEISVDDDFFALGGDSLLMTRYLSLVRSKAIFGEQDLSLRALHDHASIAGLCEFMHTQNKARVYLESVERVRAEASVLEQGEI